jgi:SAM-dependent methyltransferase
MRATVVGAVLLAVSACSSVRAQQPAEEVLKAAGIKSGLAVQLGCRDGKATMVAQAGEGLVVQCLDTDPTNVEEARARIRSLGLGGKASADVFDGRELPYVDNLVNLIVAENLGEVAMSEVMRVLCPGSVAYVKQQGTWRKPCNFDYVPHITLGYFPNGRLADLARKEAHAANATLLAELGDAEINYPSIRLYAFTDMATFATLPD